MEITQTRQWAGNIVTFWNHKGIKLETCAREQQISEAAKATGIPFPLPFKELYKLANGFKDFDWLNMFKLNKLR